jgi:hypothetical protein
VNPQPVEQHNRQFKSWKIHLKSHNTQNPEVNSGQVKVSSRRLESGTHCRILSQAGVEYHPPQVKPRSEMIDRCPQRIRSASQLRQADLDIVLMNTTTSTERRARWLCLSTARLQPGSTTPKHGFVCAYVRSPSRHVPPCR